jgi:D-3-phosphoglycerate dehydrogenase
LEEIRITCYGSLTPQTGILIKPAIKGALSRIVEEGITLINAQSKANELGIKTLLREPDNSKGYSDSVTVDIVVRQGEKSCESSVRGKLIEGEPVIVRIGDFHDLGIHPRGNQCFVIYDNKPGVIGTIATLLGGNTINIESIVARRDTVTGSKQLLVIRTAQAITRELLASIRDNVEAKAGVTVYMAQDVAFGE